MQIDNDFVAPEFKGKHAREFNDWVSANSDFLNKESLGRKIYFSRKMKQKCVSLEVRINDVEKFMLFPFDKKYCKCRGITQGDLKLIPKFPYREEEGKLNIVFYFKNEFGTELILKNLKA